MLEMQVKDGVQVWKAGPQRIVASQLVLKGKKENVAHQHCSVIQDNKITHRKDGSLLSATSRALELPFFVGGILHG